MKRAPRKGEGRPSIFTNDLANTICDRIAHGESLRKICKDDEMPNASTIYLWLLDEDKKEFFKQYARAKDAQAELMFDELLEIADNSEHDILVRENADGGEYEVPNHEFIQRSRLRVDTRKWYLSKVLPKKFGDKLDLTSDGEKLPSPIYGGKSNTVQGHNSNEEDISTD